MPELNTTGETESEEKSAAGSFRSRMRLAYIWTIVGSTARYGASLGISIVLVRLLKPDDYGLIGMVSVFTELLAVIYDWGLGKAVVHFREVNADEERPTYFTISLLLGGCFTALLFFSAPLVAMFYREPRLVLLLRVMSFSLVVGSVKTVSGSILIRELRFRQLSIIDIVASLVAGIVAIVMAYFGLGVWSLVANLFLLWLLQAVMYGWYVPPRFRLALNRQVAIRLWRYGAPVIGSSLLYKFYDDADYLVVGKVLGPGPLGYYSVAFRLAMLINDRISAVINRVAFPSFAHLKDDHSKVIAHWFAVTQRVTLVTFPLLVWLGVNAEDFVRLVLGPRWLPAVVPLQFLCLVTAVKILTNVVGQILAAVGYPDVVFRYDLLTAVALPIGFFVGCKYGQLAGLGIAWCTVFPVVRYLFLLGARRVLRFNFGDYIRSFAGSLLVSGICTLLMLPAGWMLESGWLRISIRSLLWLAGFLACIAIRRDLRNVVRDTFANISAARVPESA